MVYTNKLKLTILQQEILSTLYMNAGKSFNQRRLAKLIGVSQPAITKSLPLLKKKEFIIVKQDKESKRWNIELNLSNNKVIQLKRVENLKLFYDSGLSEFLEQECAGATIILFGSYSKGEDIINSDIDIAIIGRKEKKIDLDNFDKIFNKKINLNFYYSFATMPKQLKNNILNGIILSGSVDL